MEALTEMRFEGSESMQAYCETCKKWIEQVDICLDCYPNDVDYLYCQECNTALARSN